MTRRKEITSKLPWAAAATIIVVAVGLGAWALLGQAPAGTATITAVAGQGVVFAGGIPSYSGIENVYIVKAGQNYAENFSGLGTDNVLGAITVDDGSCDIPYETNFVIVVAVKGHDENMAYVNTENMYVYISITGSFSDTDNTNITSNRTIFEDGGVTFIRVNHYFDNGGSYYKLPANGSITIDPIEYYCYK